VLGCVLVLHGPFAISHDEGKLQSVYDRTDHALQSKFVSLVGEEVYE
jgi:hypothetical protein